MAYGIIYRSVGPTGRIYIGQTVKTLLRRKAQHKYMAIKGDIRTLFQIALLDEGFENFTWEVIDTAETLDELNQKEAYWVDFYHANDPAFGYNARGGGVSGWKMPIKTREKIGEKNRIHSLNMSPEVKRKISIAKKGTVPWNKGKTGVYSAETLQRQRESQLRRIRARDNDTSPMTGTPMHSE